MSLQKVKSPYDKPIPLLTIHPRESPNETIGHTKTFDNIHSSIIHNRQKVETQIPINV